MRKEIQERKFKELSTRQIKTNYKYLKGKVETEISKEYFFLIKRFFTPVIYHTFCLKFAKK